MVVDLASRDDPTTFRTDRLILAHIRSRMRIGARLRMGTVSTTRALDRRIVRVLIKEQLPVVHLRSATGHTA